MMTTRRHALFLGLALGVLGACSATNTTSTTPQEQAQITVPSTGMQVTATIAAVTLGDECGSSSGGFAGAPAEDCAPTPADAGADGAAGKSAGGCGGTSYCQQSNVQIAFTTGQGTKSAKVEIIEVTLHDAVNGAKVDTLLSSAPKAWTGSAYTSWDETLKPASQTKASYNLSAPGWAKMSSSTTNSYAQKYRLHVTLEIDGVMITLESAVLNREPQVAT